jgi:hypothetical protein
VQLQPLVDALRSLILGRDVLHADETPVAMLKPGNGKTHRAYLWAYSPGAFDPMKAVIYDFTETRSGKNAREFLGDWRGKLICDDYSGYKATIALGATECGCLAHARRKFFDLFEANKSQVAEQALGYFGQLYEIERDLQELDANERRQARQERAKPIADALHAWMLAHRLKVPDGSAIAKALAYSLGRWAALTRYLDDGNLPPDNNHIENQIRPVAVGRSYVQSRIMLSRQRRVVRRSVPGARRELWRCCAAHNHWCSPVVFRPHQRRAPCPRIDSWQGLPGVTG